MWAPTTIQPYDPSRNIPPIVSTVSCWFVSAREGKCFSSKNAVNFYKLNKLTNQTIDLNIFKSIQHRRCMFDVLSDAEFQKIVLHLTFAWIIFKFLLFLRKIHRLNFYADVGFFLFKGYVISMNTHTYAQNNDRKDGSWLWMNAI